MIDVCKVHSIHLMAYSSFGAASWVELDHPAATTLPSLFTHDTITRIAAAHSRTPAQVLLRWATQRGITVIPKSSNPGRLVENLDSAFDLTDDEIAAISQLDRGFRIASGIDPRLNVWA
jgi:D-xylose reductase